MNPIIKEGNINFYKLIQLINKNGIDAYLKLFNVDFLIYIVNNFKNFNKKTKDIIKNQIICYFDKHIYNTSYMRGWNILCDIWHLGLFPIIQKPHKFTISYLLQQNTKDFKFNLTLTIGLLKGFNPKYKDYLYVDGTEKSLIEYIITQNKHEYIKHINKEIKFKKSDISKHIIYLYNRGKVYIELDKYCDFNLLGILKYLTYLNNIEKIYIVLAKYCDFDLMDILKYITYVYNIDEDYNELAKYCDFDLMGYIEKQKAIVENDIVNNII